MYSMENYIWGLVLYGLGAMMVAWYVTWISGLVPFRHLRNVFCLFVCAVLFTPILPYSDQPYLAPAFVTLVFESLTHSESERPLRGFIPIGFVYVVLLVLYVINEILRSRRKKRRTHTKKKRAEVS